MSDRIFSRHCSRCLMNSDGATLEHIWKLFCSVFAEQTSRIDAHGKDRGSGTISKATYQLNFYAWIYLDTHVKSKNKWEFCVTQTTLHFIIQVLFFFTTQITAASQHSLQMWRFPNEFSWMSRLVFLLRKTHFNKRKIIFPPSNWNAKYNDKCRSNVGP